MPFATLLLVTSTLAAPTAIRPADERAGDLSRTSLAWLAPVSIAAQRSQPQASSPRPHQFGFGGSITASNGGAGGDEAPIRAPEGRSTAGRDDRFVAHHLHVGRRRFASVGSHGRSHTARSA